MPTINAGDINLTYEEFGTGQEPLVLVHGWTGTRRNWRAMIDCLPLDRLRVYALDSDGLLQRIITLAGEAGVHLTDASSQPPTLEAVFLSLTGRDLRE